MTPKFLAGMAEPLNVAAVEGEVVLSAPLRPFMVALSPEAARETARRLLQAAEEAELDREE